jgi:hypothetical protein
METILFFRNMPCNRCAPRGICRILLLLALLGLTMPARGDVPDRGESVEVTIRPVDRVLDIVEWSSPPEEIEWVAGIRAVLPERLEEVSLVWAVRDWDGTVVEQTVPLVLGAERNPNYKNFTPVRIAYSPRKLGWHELSVRLLDGEENILAQVRRGFAVIEPARSSGRFFRYGMAGTGVRPAESEFNRYIETIRALGVDIHREIFYWPQAQQDAQAIFEFQYHDAIQQLLADCGIDVLWCFLWTPHWAVEADIPEEDWSRLVLSMPRLDHWTQFARAVASHFRGRVRYYQVWNEPDLGDYWVGTPESHARFQNAGFQAIKQVDPAAQVMNGGFGMFSMEPNPDFLERFLPLAETAHWDIRAYHDYHTMEDMQHRLEKHRELYSGSAMQDRPVWVTEGGYSSAMMGGPERQAIIDVQKVAAAPAGGLDGYFVFTLCDLDAERTEGVVTHFGLVDADFNPKPAFAAYQRLIAELSDRQYRPSPVPRAVDDKVWALLYAGTNTHRLVMWIDAVADGIPFLIKADKGTYLDTVRDIMGNAQPVIRLSDRVIITGLREAVSYLTLRGQARDPLVMPLLKLDVQPVVVPGRETPIAFTLSNPLDVPLSLSLRAKPHAVLDCTPAVVSAELEPGASQTVHGILRAAACLANRETLQFDLHSNAGAESMVVAIDVDIARLIPRAAEPGAVERVVIELDRAEQVRTLRALPGSEWQWGGPHDLSARILPAWSPDGLHLTVHATDQTHHVDDETPLWENDSIQVGLGRDVGSGDFLELGVGTHEDGSTRVTVYRSPAGYAADLGDDPRNGIEAAVEVGDKGATYTLGIPWNVLGTTETPETPFRLNILVNDDDGLGRKQWIQIAPGIGDDKDAQYFPAFSCGGSQPPH